MGNKSYVVSIVLYFIDFGPNGCNKTAITNYVNYLADKMIRNLNIMAQDYEYQRHHNIKVQDVIVTMPSCNRCATSIIPIRKSLISDILFTVSNSSREPLKMAQFSNCMSHLIRHVSKIETNILYMQKC